MTATPRERTSESDTFDYQTFTAKYPGATIAKYPAGTVVFTQGDRAEALYYIISGNAKVTVVSEHGKEAVPALLKAGDFFGEECPEARHRRSATPTATTDCEMACFNRETIATALGQDPAFAHLFMSYVLNQNEKLREDLLDQMFNSSEKRLARILLALASPGLGDQSSEIAIPVTQETLANMVGTTRSRINQFMIKFRKLGYVDYDGKIRVHNSLLNIILDNRPQTEAC